MSAKRAKTKRQRQQRKATVAARSAQARKNFAEISTPHISSYDETTLSRLSDTQLRNVARGLGNDLTKAQDHAKKEALESYYNVPKISISKRDIMYAGRPAISEQDIAAAPSKQRKLLRQQQRRRQEAQDKIARARQYDALRVERSIAKQRDIEARGLDIAESGLSEKYLQGSKKNLDLLGTKNVLKDSKFVKQMTREQLINEMLDTADKVDKPAKRARRKPKEYKNVAPPKPKQGWEKLKGQSKEDFITYRKLRGAFGNELASKFSRLSKKEKYLLYNSTGFLKLLQKVIMSPLKRLGKSRKPSFVFINDSEVDRSKAVKEINDFIDMVKKYS